MQLDVLHTVTKLQGSLQGKEVDQASVPGMVENTEGAEEYKQQYMV